MGVIARRSALRSGQCAAVDIFRRRAQGNHMFVMLLQVALGGAIGSLLRFLTISLVGAPIATLIVNVLGSFAMGALFVALPIRLAPLFMSGVLGGFTTFSAFSLDALRLYQNGQTAQAALYVAASVLLSLLAVAAGAALAQRGLA
jgi:CrcB protein